MLCSERNKHMQKKVRIALRIATGLAVIWALCLFVLCLFSEISLHRAEAQLQDSAAQLVEEKDAYEADRAMIKELREMKLELKSELRELKKQLALEKKLAEGMDAIQKATSPGDDLLESEREGSTLSELERAELRRTLLRKNKMLLFKIFESRRILSDYRTSPCLEALRGESLEKLQLIHGNWRVTVQALINAATRGEADKVSQLQVQVQELADSADVLTGNTQLYSNQAKRIIEASNSLLNAIKARQLLFQQSEKLDASDNSETSLNP